MVISNYILMTQIPMYFAFLLYWYSPIYSAGTSNLPTQQPQNCTYHLHSTCPILFALFMSTSAHQTSKTHPFFYLPLIPTLHWHPKFQLDLLNVSQMIFLWSISTTTLDDPLTVSPLDHSHNSLTCFLWNLVLTMV